VQHLCAQDLQPHARRQDASAIQITTASSLCAMLGHAGRMVGCRNRVREGKNVPLGDFLGQPVRPVYAMEEMSKARDVCAEPLAGGGCYRTRLLSPGATRVGLDTTAHPRSTGLRGASRKPHGFAPSFDTMRVRAGHPSAARPRRFFGSPVKRPMSRPSSPRGRHFTSSRNPLLFLIRTLVRI